MNYWTALSVAFANQRNYLDELYKVYPVSPNLRREIPEESVVSIEKNFKNRNNVGLVKELLKLKLFPLKDSFVPFLRRDEAAIERNPNTVNRIAGNLFAMGLETIFDRCSEPKESNRQIGPMFKNWLKSGVLGCRICEKEDDFLSADENAVFVASDEKMKAFAIRSLGYTRKSKGLDFIAKFNGTYVIAEAKFITDFGGHQNDQFEDAVATLLSHIDGACNKKVLKIAIADGVLYIKGKSKLYRFLQNNEALPIMSALVLREFLYSL